MRGGSKPSLLKKKNRQRPERTTVGTARVYRNPWLDDSAKPIQSMPCNGFDTHLRTSPARSREITRGRRQAALAAHVLVRQDRDGGRRSWTPTRLIFAWCSILLCGARLQKRDEFLDREARFTNQGPERALRERLMLRDNKPPVGWIDVAEDHMTSALAVFGVANSSECADRVSTLNRGKLRHTATSTYSSSFDGGIASS